MKRAEYQVKGRYKVLFEKSGVPGQPLDFLGIFSVRRESDGAIAISGVRPSEKDLEELNRLVAKIDGRLSVSVPIGTTVVRHNAQSDPFLGDIWCIQVGN
jgi:hypothetical protein